jgi:hypothetical protein
VDRISRLRGTERCWRRLSREPAPDLDGKAIR